MYIFHNDTLKKLDDAKICLKDFGFARGVAVFELIRVYGNHPFHMDEHLDRLCKSLSTCGFSLSFLSMEKLKRQIIALIEKHQFRDSLAMVYITQGVPSSLDFGIGISEDDEPQVYVLNTKIEPFSDEYPLHEKYYKQGVAVKCIDSQRHMPEAKTINYITAVVETAKYAKQGYDDIVYVSSEGYIKEASRANLFFVKEGVLISPVDGALDGITRKFVVSLADKLSIPFEERDVNVSELPEMSECFMTGSRSEMVPVRKVDDVTYNRDNFSVYARLWDAYKDEIKQRR